MCLHGFPAVSIVHVFPEEANARVPRQFYLQCQNRRPSSKSVKKPIQNAACSVSLLLVRSACFSYCRGRPAPGLGTGFAAGGRVPPGGAAGPLWRLFWRQAFPLAWRKRGGKPIHDIIVHIDAIAESGFLDITRFIFSCHALGVWRPLAEGAMAQCVIVVAAIGFRIRLD